MNYSEIKSSLARASRLVNAGQLNEADTLIRSMIGQGMSHADLSANLSRGQIRKLRKHRAG